MENPGTLGGMSTYGPLKTISTAQQNRCQIIAMCHCKCHFSKDCGHQTNRAGCSWSSLSHFWMLLYRLLCNLLCLLNQSNYGFLQSFVLDNAITSSKHTSFMNTPDKVLRIPYFCCNVSVWNKSNHVWNMDPVAAAGVEKLVVVKKTPSLYFLLEYTPYLNIDGFGFLLGW